jgi:hypothetical protein
MACTVVGDVFLEVHDRHAPSDEEWQASLDVLGRRMPQIRCGLIVSDGGAPNAPQRQGMARLVEGLGRSHLPRAVVSASSLARGAVTALRWMGQEVQAFTPEDLAQALDHLEVPVEARARIMSEIGRLRLKLAVSNSNPRLRAG